MNSLSRSHRVVVLAVVGCVLPWAGLMLGADQVFGQRGGDSKADAEPGHRSAAARAVTGPTENLSKIIVGDVPATTRPATRAECVDANSTTANLRDARHTRV